MEDQNRLKLLQGINTINPKTLHMFYKSLLDPCDRLELETIEGLSLSLLAPSIQRIDFRTPVDGATLSQLAESVIGVYFHTQVDESAVSQLPPSVVTINGQPRSQLSEWLLEY